MAYGISRVIGTAILAWACLKIYQLIYNLFLHPLRTFPGPVAAKATSWWKTYIEVVTQESMTVVLTRLHKQHGLSLLGSHDF